MNFETAACKSLCDLAFVRVAPDGGGYLSPSYQRTRGAQLVSSTRLFSQNSDAKCLARDCCCEPQEWSGHMRQLRGSSAPSLESATGREGPRGGSARTLLPRRVGSRDRQITLGPSRAAGRFFIEAPFARSHDVGSLDANVTAGGKALAPR